MENPDRYIIRSKNIFNNNLQNFPLCDNIRHRLKFDQSSIIIINCLITYKVKIMYIYKYYIETDNEVKPIYDLEFTVRYTMFEDVIEVIDERITEVLLITEKVQDEVNKDVFFETKEKINDRELEEKLYSKYFKQWDELEGELWEDWDNRQASFEDYYD
jgi:hypothetical protein